MRERVLFGGASPQIQVHNEGREAHINRHTCRGVHCFLDVNGTEDSEGRQPRRRNCMDLPSVWDDLCRSSALPLGWSLFAELVGVEKRRIGNHQSKDGDSEGRLASF